MAIYQDTYYAQTFQFVSGGVPLDITGATFVAAFRKQLSDPDPPLLLLTSSPVNGLTITDPINGVLLLSLVQAQTKLLPIGYVFADFMRTDLLQSPVRYFGARFTVKQPVTRL